MKSTTQNTFLELLPNFKQYWENNSHSKNSVSSYMSYIRGAIRIVSKSDLLNGFDAASVFNSEEMIHKSFTSFNKTTQSIKLLIALLVKESKNNTLSKKTKSNYLSGITAYFNFLYLNGYQFSNNQSIASNIKKILKTANLRSISFGYKHNEISSNFNTRLNTQDRVYEHTCFPICLINQIIGLDKDLTKRYRNIKKAKRESTKFLITQDGQNSVPLSSINSILIVPNKKCEITTKSGDKYQVYTEAAPFNKTNYEQLSAIDICDLSIDHDTPLKKLLEEKCAYYPTFLKLGTKLVDFFKEKTNDLKTIRDKIVNIDAKTALKIVYSENIDVQFAKDLYNELETLYSQMEYTIMYGPYNSKKSDSNND